MANILSFEFEELPLVITNGIEAGLINGCAEIEYTSDGDWHIDSICVEGYQRLTTEERAAGKRPWIYVTAPALLAALIGLRLQSDWHRKVCDAVYEQLASDREDAKEARAEMRREDRAGL